MKRHHHTNCPTTETLVRKTLTKNTLPQTWYPLDVLHANPLSCYLEIIIYEVSTTFCHAVLSGYIEPKGEQIVGD